MARTLKPLNARLAERLTAVVVFPTPPFLFANTILAAIPYHRANTSAKRFTTQGSE